MAMAHRKKPEVGMRNAEKNADVEKVNAMESVNKLTKKSVFYTQCALS